MVLKKCSQGNSIKITGNWLKMQFHGTPLDLLNQEVWGLELGSNNLCFNDSDACSNVRTTGP